MTLPLLLFCDHAGSAPGLPPGFGAGFRVLRTGGLRESLERLAAFRPELVVLAPLVGSGQAEIAAIERARAGSPPLPLLLLLGPQDLARGWEVLRSLEAEAWEIACLPCSAEELALRCEHLTRQARALERIAELRHRASHDDRTDLLRPLAFEERLRSHVSAAQRHGFDLALVLIDLDGFGLINKELDHTSGDRVIEATADAIRSRLRTEDVAGRLGGDEFGLILPYTSPIHAGLVTERVRGAIAQVPLPRPPRGKAVAVGASAGYETFDGRDLASESELREHAEAALMAAKARGGGCTLYYRSLASGASGATPTEPR